MKRIERLKQMDIVELSDELCFGIEDCDDCPVSEKYCKRRGYMDDGQLEQGWCNGFYRWLNEEVEE